MLLLFYYFPKAADYLNLLFYSILTRVYYSLFNELFNYFSYL